MVDPLAAPVPIVPAGAAPAEPDEGISKKLARIFNGLIEVKVVTIVHDVPLEVKNEGGRTTASFDSIDQQVSALITIFNLVDGDVINVIPPSLQDNTAIRAFHTAQVDKSLVVLPANIEALVNLGKAIVNEFS